jgi:hypothetical protein
MKAKGWSGKSDLPVVEEVRLHPKKTRQLAEQARAAARRTLLMSRSGPHRPSPFGGLGQLTWLVSWRVLCKRIGNDDPTKLQLRLRRVGYGARHWVHFTSNSTPTLSAKVPTTPYKTGRTLRPINFRRRLWRTRFNPSACWSCLSSSPVGSVTVGRLIFA